MTDTIYDRDIRQPLCDYLELKFGIVRFLDEIQFWRSRVDLIMVCPECLCGIEIKSDTDTYVRLSRQVKDYDRYFDHNIALRSITSP